MAVACADSPIRMIGLSKSFRSKLAVDAIDLSVHRGEVFGFLGPNGAGKSTTIRMLLGMLRPSGGKALIFGSDAVDAPVAHRHLAYVPPDVALWPSLTGAECLELLANLGPGIDGGYRDDLIQGFDLEVDRKCGTYSTGNRQKVALVAAFATRAELLILDEPTSGLDPLMEQAFRRCIAAAAGRGQTVFLSSHHLAEVESICDRVGILREGRLVEVAGLDDLRRLRRTEVNVEFDASAAVPVDELERTAGVNGVRRISRSRLSLTLTGSPTPALRVLASTGVTSLDVREPSLEEIFLEYYGSTD